MMLLAILGVPAALCLCLYVGYRIGASQWPQDFDSGDAI